MAGREKTDVGSLPRLPPPASLTVFIAIKGNSKSKDVGLVNWALDKFVAESMFMFKLIHVRPPITTIPTAENSNALTDLLEGQAIYYNSLPPVSKAYGVLCFMTTAALHLGLYDLGIIALSYEDVLKRFQVWRLVTNFFFLGPFSLTFAFRLLLIARHGVELERGPFDKRTADYVWMFIFGAISLLAMAIIPVLSSGFMGDSLVFMIVYVWGREFPNASFNIHGLFELKGFYLPWYMLAFDLILGNPLMEDLLGIAAGHLYYFLTVLYPLAGGRFTLNTPLWVHKLVLFWGVGYQQNAPVRQNTAAEDVFQGRGRRTGGASASTQAQPNQDNDGVAFRGRSHRLDGGG